MQREPGRRFAEIAAGLEAGGAGGPLDEAALLLAAEFDAALDLAAELDRLQELAERAANHLGSTAGIARVHGLIEFLAVQEGFHGNLEDYEDPDNSFLNRVLDRRTGIPITLAIVYIEVGRRVGVEIHGIGFPGHFLIRAGRDADLIVDPFTGAVLDDEECRERWQRALGPGASFERGALRPARLDEILLRMLRNLKHHFAGRGAWVDALACCDRALLLAPDDPTELRDRGTILAQQGCPAAAARDLERFLLLAPDDPAADDIRARLTSLRSHPPTLH